MIYTTTKCPYCGCYTRKRETGVPRVDLGQTILICPRCGTPIIDPINKEFEFMTKNQQRKWRTRNLVLNAIFSAILQIGLLLYLFLSSIINGYTIAIVLFSILLSIRLIFTTYAIIKMCKQHIGEQKIYESLLRTSNEEYVNMLINNVAYNNKKYKYRPLDNRTELINDFKKYSTDDFHNSAVDNFNKLLNIKNNNQPEIKSVPRNADNMRTFIDGGFIPSAIDGIIMAVKDHKDEKEYKNQNGNDVKTIDTTAVKESSFQKLVKKLKSFFNSIIKHLKNIIAKLKSIFNKSNNKTNKDFLLELKELFDDGLITEQEYNEKRKQYIEKI
ncbi:MAG: SHOCT domain-containing protein [Oscillospiraceae bacterium]